MAKAMGLKVKSFTSQQVNRLLGKQQGEARLSQFVGSAYNENAQAEVVHINAPLTKEQYTDTAKVRDEILSPLIGVEVQIDSDGRLVSFDKQGIKDALKKRNLHRTILGEIEKIVQKSFYFDYEASDGKAKHTNVLGQFTYVVPVEMNGTVYRAEIKVDRMRDTPAGKGDFKQQSVFKVADVALSTGLDTRQSRSEAGASSTTSASVRLGDLMEGRKPKTQRVLFSFIGEVGAESFGKNSVILRSLKRAKKMFEAGKFEDEIWEATGWRIGADGKWRYEIPDSINFNVLEDLIYKTNEKRRIVVDTYGEDFFESDDAKDLVDPYSHMVSARLHEVYTGKELFKALPYLGNFRIAFIPSLWNLGFKGQYQDALGRIFVVIDPDSTPQDVAQTLIHEIQHAIQRAEGFAIGGGSFEYEINGAGSEKGLRNTKEGY